MAEPDELRFLLDHFRAQTGVDVRRDPEALERVTRAANELRDDLARDGVSEVNLPFLFATAKGPQHLTMRVDRATFDEWLLARETMERVDLGGTPPAPAPAATAPQPAPPPAAGPQAAWGPIMQTSRLLWGALLACVFSYAFLAIFLLDSPDDSGALLPNPTFAGALALVALSDLVIGPLLGRKLLQTKVASLRIPSHEVVDQDAVVMFRSAPTRRRVPVDLGAARRQLVAAAHQAWIIRTSIATSIGVFGLVGLIAGAMALPVALGFIGVSVVATAAQPPRVAELVKAAHEQLGIHV